MDPATLGLAAAALLASKFGDGFGKNAGSTAWSGIKRLREMIAAKFKGQADAESALQLATSNRKTQHCATRSPSKSPPRPRATPGSVTC
jgi:hypothetical protein